MGGRLTLIKAVLSNLPIYYLSIYKVPVAVEKQLEALRNNFFIGGELQERKMTWVAWRKCLASTELGGLGIGSIYALNRALLFKWVWRFRQNNNDLWANIIMSIYGADGGIGRLGRSSVGSPWCAVVKAVTQLRDRGVDLLAACVRKVGDGRDVFFWHDVWHGDQPFKERYHRVYALDNEKDCCVAERVQMFDWNGCLRRLPRGGLEMEQFSALQDTVDQVVLSGERDATTWQPDLDGGYTVKSARNIIDDAFLDIGSLATR